MRGEIVAMSSAGRQETGKFKAGDHGHWSGRKEANGLSSSTLPHPLRCYLIHSLCCSQNDVHT